MSNLTSVTLTAGIPTVGTGDVSTIDALMAQIAQVAHDAAAAAVAPTLIGLYADLAVAGPSSVSATNDSVRARGDGDGAAIVRPQANLASIVTGNATNTDGTSTSCIAASGDATIKHYLTSVVLCNSSASNITVDIKDGATTKTSLPVPAGGGVVYNPPVPIPGTANTAWNFDPSAAATTVTCSMIAFKSKV